MPGPAGGHESKTQEYGKKDNPRVLCDSERVGTQRRIVLDTCISERGMHWEYKLLGNAPLHQVRVLLVRWRMADVAGA
jgi:hypothetical protein